MKKFVCFVLILSFWATLASANHLFYVKDYVVSYIFFLISGWMLAFGFRAYRQSLEAKAGRDSLTVVKDFGEEAGCWMIGLGFSPKLVKMLDRMAAYHELSCREAALVHAIEATNTIDDFVRRGDKVVIKPKNGGEEIVIEDMDYEEFWDKMRESDGKSPKEG